MSSNDDAVTVIGVILIVLDVLTVASRFYSRWSAKAGFGWDDWTILMALVAGILPGILTVWASSVSKTGPAAASNVDPSYVFTPADVLYTKIVYTTSMLYFFCTCITKFSLLLLLHRIFAVNKSFRVPIYAAEAAVVAFWISATVANLLDCIPLEWNWKNGNSDPRYCFNYNTFWLVTGIFESVIDLAILVLPFGMISRLQLSRSKKFGVTGIFLLGGFVLFSGVAKVVLSYQRNSRSPDFSRATLWTMIHLYTGIICANLPPSGPLFVKVARMSTGLRVRLASRGKDRSSLSSGQPSENTPGDNRRDDKWRADVEVAEIGYEPAGHGRDS